MDYILAAITCVAAFYAFTYGRWLKANGNRKGAIGVFVLAFLGVALSAYQVLSGK